MNTMTGKASAARAVGDIRVFLADDHAVLRAGLRLLNDSQSDMTVVGEATDGREAIERVTALAQRRAVDVVVLDLGMPRLGGMEVLRRLRHAFPGLAVVVLTAHASEYYLLEVVRAGAAAYVLKARA